VDEPSVDKQAYVNKVCNRYRHAKPLPFDAKRAAENNSRVGDCHNNVDAWIAAHPEDQAVRGWITWYNSVVTAHSVVCSHDGKLFDITPLGDESIRGGLRFVPHLGDEATFAEMKAVNHFMCSDECA
jgi:hypothetical protein